MEIVTKIAPICLALIMLGLGMGLSVQDFIRVGKQPKDFFIGLVCQLILLPIVAYAIIQILDVPIELALGFMIIAAAPGGVTSNVLTKFANGDVALSVSLTAIISLISIFSVPFIVLKSAELLDISNILRDISMVSISLKMFFVVTLPIIIGMLIKKYATNFVINNTLAIQRISIALFIFVFIAIYIEEWDRIISFLTKAGLVAFILNLVMMIVGYYVAKFFSSGIKQRRCISLECGLQNGTLAVVVATQIFDDIIYLVPTAAYALIMMMTSIIFVYLLKKNS